MTHSISIATRLKEERIKAQLSQEKLAQAAGVTRQSQSKYEKGIRQPDSLYLSAIAQHGLDINYIITGNKHAIHYGAVLNKSKSSTHQIAESKNEYQTDTKMESFVTIPFCTTPPNISAHSSENTFLNLFAFNKKWLQSELSNNIDHLRLILIDDEGMEPTLKNGDVLIIDQNEHDVKQDGIYVIKIDNVLSVKRLQRLPNKQIKVSSDNTNYGAFYIDIEKSDTSVSIIAKVVWSSHRM